MFLAQNNGTRRTTTQSRKAPAKNGKGGGAKKGSASRKKNAQITLAEIIRRREVASTILFVVGLLLLLVAAASGADGAFWNKLHLFYYAVFGITGFILPPVILFRAVTMVLGVSSRRQSNKLFEIFVFAAIVCGFIHIGRVSAQLPELSFGEAISTVYKDITSGGDSYRLSGGVVGALIGGGVFAICGSTGISNAICALLLVADIMFLFGITLFKVFSRMKEPAIRVGEKTSETVGNVRADIERKRRENAEYRAQRAAQGNDPTRVVDDFYKSNFKDITPEDVKQHEKEREKAKRKDEKTAAKVSQPSVFDMIFSTPDENEKKAAEKDAQNTREDNDVYDKLNRSEDIFAAAAVNARKKDAERISSLSSSDAPADIAAADDPFGAVPLEPVSSAGTDKKAAAEPLSDSESEEINSELDDGLAVQNKVEYRYPPLDCLQLPKPAKQGFEASELRANGEKLIEALNSFNVSASIVDVVPGPTVTRYELSPARGVKISKFTGLSDDLALHMAAPAGLRIEAPIPNKSAIGIEIPNKNKTTVTFREVIDTEAYRNASSKLTVALGKNIAGDPVYCDLAKMPHLLVAGTTGSGKSICLHTMIISILYNASPDEVKLLLIDPKQVEFGDYNGIPHLLVPVVSDPRKASGALGWAVTEMLSRYKTLNANGVRDIGAYNALCEQRDDLQKMPQIVIVIDELADLMSAAPAEVEDSIQRLAQMARAAGMHLVIATQRPSTDVITGVIKANIPSRIALMVKQQIDSRIIIDEGGAEKLIGHGDMLYYPVGQAKPTRLQGAFITDDERKSIVAFIKGNGAAEYDDTVQQEIDRQAAEDNKKKGGASGASSAGMDKNDELLMKAIELFVGTPEKASISALQRHLGLGFAKAGRLMDTLEENGIVGPAEGSKPRKVLITKQQWYEMNAMSSDVTDGKLPADGQADSFTDNTPDGTGE